MMFSSRNIHFAVLGIILGASSGYVLAFYQIDKKIPEKTRTLAGAGAGSGSQAHPDVSNEQVMAMFKQQLERDPNNVEVLTRYGDFLSDTQHFQEAADTYAKVLKAQPGNLDVQTFMGTALWNLGKKEEAVAAYEKSLKADPNHVPSLYYMAMVDLDLRHDIAAASDKLAKMEKIDPSQPALKELRQRIEDERQKPK
jgi:tetratricopeptide (TPR) repeat protein